MPTEIGITSNPNPTKDPLDLFQTLIESVKAYKPNDFITMNLATVNENEGVHNRTVLYHGISGNDGIMFATDRNTQKFIDILKNAKVALTFLFQLQVDDVQIYRQIRINGIAQELSKIEIAKQWDMQPIFAKVRSLVYLDIPKELEDVKLKYQKLMNDYEAGQTTIEVPDTHTVLEILPKTLDFYQSTANSVSDRIFYQKENEKWIMKRSYG